MPTNLGCVTHAGQDPRILTTQHRRANASDLLLRALTETEAGAIITSWPSCPRFASRRVDRLTVRRDRGAW
jgi:hypothetical protein